MSAGKDSNREYYVYQTVHHCNSWRIKDQLDVTCCFISFHFLCPQHVSNINMSIIRSLRLFCWITTLVVLFLVRCVMEFRCGWVGLISMLQANTNNVVIHQNSHKLLMMGILMSETCWAHKKWNKIASDIKLVFILQLSKPWLSRFKIVYI